MIPLGSRAMLALHGDSRSARRGDAAKTTSAAWARLPSQCGGYAAQARPDWGFLLLGGVERDNPFLRQLNKLSNVYLPCPRPARAVRRW